MTVRTRQPANRPHRAVVLLRRIAALSIVLTLLFALTACGGSSESSAGNACAPSGEQAVSAVPANLESSPKQVDRYTTANVKPVDSIDIGTLGLRTPGTLTVGTLGDAAPSICIDKSGAYTGFDNELLKAVAAKLGLKVAFTSTDFSTLLAQVGNHRFDVGSSSINATDERRKSISFTNGYDFAYISLVVPAGSAVKDFTALGGNTRVGVVQGTMQDEFVTNKLELEPKRFPDYATALANLRAGKLDAWVAPSPQAVSATQEHKDVTISANTFDLDNSVAWAVAPDKQNLVAALNSGLDAIIADGTWSKLYADWVPRELPQGWKPGSKAIAAPTLPDFAAIIAARGTPEPVAAAPEKSTLTKLKETFLNWDSFREALPILFKTGLPNTLLLTLIAGIIGTLAGILLAVLGISRTRWLRWPARIYTDIFRGLPTVVVILLIGLGLDPVMHSITGDNPFWLGGLALGLVAGAYIGEIFRSGIQSVEPGQMEAARAIGFSRRRALSLVVVPQGVRRVLPALMNQYISLLKDTSLIYFLGLTASQRDLFTIGRDMNSNTGNLSPLLAAGLVYLILTIPSTHLVNYFDRRMRTGKD